MGRMKAQPNATASVAQSIKTATEASLGKPSPQEKRILDELAKPTGHVLSAARRATFADAMADRLVKNTTFLTNMDKLADAEEYKRIGPVQVLWDMMQSFGVSQNWSDDTQVFTGWPMPNTKEEGMDKKGKALVPDTSQRPADWYVDTDPNDQSKSIDRSWYHTEWLAIDRKRGDASIQTRLATLQGDDAPVMPESDRLAKIAALKMRLTRGSNTMRDAIEVYDKIHDLHSVFSHLITIKIATQKHDNGVVSLMSHTMAPIKIIDKENPEVARAMTIAEFLALDVARANELGGPDGASWKSIINSGKKKRKAGAGQGQQATTEALSKYNARSFANALPYIAYMLETPDKSAALDKMLEKSRNSDDDDLLTTFGDAIFSLAGRLFDTNKNNLKLTELGKAYVQRT